MRNPVRYLMVLLLAFSFLASSAQAQQPGVNIAKLGTPNVESGGLMSYSVFLVFQSLLPCTNDFGGLFCTVSLTDTLPNGFLADEPNINAFLFSILGASGPIPCTLNAGVVDCTVPDLLPGDFIELSIPGNAPLLPEGSMFTNTADSVVSLGPVAIQTVQDTFESTIVGPGPQVELSIFKSGSPDPVVEGNQVQYGITIVNSGPDTATGVQVTDILPNTTTFAGSTFAGCVDGGTSVTCDVPDIPAGGFVNGSITVNVPSPFLGDSILLNVISVSATETDIAPANNVSSDETSVIPPPPVPPTESNLIVTKTGPDTVPFGDLFNYTINVFNEGPDPAFNVRVRDALPPGIILPGGIGSIFVQGGGPCIAIPAGFRCDLLGSNPLLPGESRVINVPVAYVGPPGPPLPFEPFPVFNVANVLLVGPGPNQIPQVDPIPENNTFVQITNIITPPPDPTFSDLVLTKSVPDIIIPGTVGPPTNTFGYSIEVANLGPDEAFNLIVRDIIPDDVTFLTFPGNCSIQFNPLSMRNELVCNIASLADGEIARIDIRAVYTGVAPLFPAFRAVFNLASVDFGLRPQFQIDPDTTNNTDVGISRALIPPDITLSDLDVRKSAPAIIIENVEFSYFVEVTNLGPDTALNVMLRDLIPADISINPANLAGQGCAIVLDEIICDVGTLMNGQTVSFEFLATYTGTPPPLPGSIPVFNLATVFFDPAIIPGDPPNVTVQIDPETANNTASAISQAIQPPPTIRFVDLFVVKTDTPDPVVQGENFIYNIFVYNFGPTAAVGVRVIDTLPTVDGTPLTVVDIPNFCNEAGGIVTCNIPLIEPIPANGGLRVIPIEVTAPMLPNGSDPIMIINAAQAFARPFVLLPQFNAIQIDLAPSNNADYEKTTIVPTPPPVSDLLIIKTDTPDPVIEEEFLTYTLFVKNTGPDAAFGVLVSDWLPQVGLDLSTVTFETTPNVVGCIQNPDFPMFDEPYKVECEILSLSVEESATISIRVQTLPLPDGVEFLEIFNLAKVESLGDEINQPSADPNPLNNISVESTLIGPFVPVADVFVIKSDSPDPVLVNAALTYSLFLSNAGPDPATGVVVVDTLPASVNFVSATPDKGTCGAPVGNVLTCNIGDLAVGEFIEVRVVVSPQVPGSILNVAQITANEHDPKSSNNTSVQLTTVNPAGPPPPGGDDPDPIGADLFVLKFVSPNPVEVGDEVTFTIIVGNNGPFGASVTLIDTLPAGVTLLSASSSQGECTDNGAQVFCELTVPQLGEGEIVTVDIVVRADQTGTLPNVALLEGNPTDPDNANNVAIVALEVVGLLPDPPTNPNPTPSPTNAPPGDTGGGNGDGNSNCSSSLAGANIDHGNVAINFAILLLPLMIFGIRSIRRKK